jgi:hypothetical protein
MADERRPVLVFPQPVRTARVGLPPRFPRYKTPSRQRQAERLATQVAALDKAINDRRLLLSSETLGAEPEGVLVLDVVGSLSKFHRAAKAAGIEWLGEQEEGAEKADDDFAVLDFDEETEEEVPSDRDVPRHLYLTATNLRTLQKFKSLWERWLKGNTFERGQKNWPNLFARLRSVRLWDASDRLRQSRILEYWKQSVAINAEPGPFGVQLWYRQNARKREAAEETVRAFVQRSGGATIGRATVINEIAYHAMIVRLPAKRVTALLEDVNAVALAKCDQVMLFRPTGQVAFISQSPSNVLAELTAKTSPKVVSASKPTKDEPEIAILDGLPEGDHEALKGRLDIDDPDNWAPTYLVTARNHGTNVASNVLHGDLGGEHHPLIRKIYVRPILRPELPGNPTARELIPADVDELDLVQNAVTRALSVRPSIRVFLLAVADPAQVFAGKISPWARLLDYLSHKHNILFVVGAGNHPAQLVLPVGTATFQGLNAADRDRLVTRQLIEQSTLRGLLAPADSVNSLAIGAANEDSSSLGCPTGTEFPIITRKASASYAAVGPGYRRSVKPDFLTDGGRLPYRLSLQSTAETRMDVPSGLSVHPGIVTAIPHATFKYRHDSGTTFAAALTTRRLALALEYLRDPAIAAGSTTGIPGEYMAVLAKAFVAHWARWESAATGCIDGAIGNGADTRAKRRAKTRMLGYGYVPTLENFDCSGKRVTCLGYGNIGLEQGHRFDFPLPPVLATLKKPVWRRLTMTLAYLTPIKPTVQTYRMVHLYADQVLPANVRFAVKEHQDVTETDSARGTLQHLVFEGSDAPVFTDGDKLSVIVSSRKDAYDSKKDDGQLAVRYGLVVSLEVAENVDVYTQVRDRIRPRVRILGRS